ncbi:MAG: dimethyl sulfoxide reductase anchor subunit [Gammaproteobacteria bacterium]|nr:dimethyl sulfoxide reductase anchor subunit [Gammaproteobacteria bacterium]
MYKVRDDEPQYAFIPDVATPQSNRYGKAIQLVDEADPLAGQSLNINGDSGVSDHPNRYKQHGFHFTADNCIGCHACEAACSEKNDLPAHISFRSVGYVEGGSYPAYRRLNISMACNHCDDPVCLKGCPTRAYTKYAEYGAVLQDPETCFGCGYCTWVCPYNAPQLDPIEGRVSKCNMCVDRLEVGLKPACAAACLGGALDFGLIETTPALREQAKTRIPGFPDPEITHPNIRFQQVKTLPRDMTRPDTMPLHYQRDEQGEGEYKTRIVEQDRPRQWNLRKLSSREDPLVIFTLLSQAVVGAFLLLFLGPLFGLELLSDAAHPLARNLLLFTLLGMQGVAMGISMLHLGKPHRFYRAFNNLRYSPVSREVASLALFFTLLAGYTLLGSGLFGGLPDGLLHGLVMLCGGGGAAIAGLVFLYAMHKIYRIPARPYWNHWQVLTSFFGSAGTLGALLVGLTVVVTAVAAGEDYAATMSVLAWIIAAGSMLEGAGLVAHARYLERRGAEAAASCQQQRTTFGKSYWARNLGLGLGVAAVLALAAMDADGYWGLLGWTMAAALIGTTALIGRALFYVLVIPTTLPGAFFWRNQGFQQHARESGLAAMPQVGVLPRTEYHELQLARARREISADWARLRQIGLRAGLRQLRSNLRDQWRQAFARP